MIILTDKEKCWSCEKIMIAEESGLWKNPHGHEFVEIVYFLEGNGYHCIDNEYYPIEKGSCFLIPPLVSHYYVSDMINPSNDGISVINLIFLKDCIVAGGEKNAFLRNLFKMFVGDMYKEQDLVENACIYCKDFDLSIHASLMKIKKEQSEKNIGYQIVIEAELKEILASLLRSYVGGLNTTLPLTHIGIVMRMVALIEQNFKEPIRVEEMANQFNFSVSSIRRIFKEIMGCSIWKYVQIVRIRNACKYLAEDNLSVEATMERIGMADKKQFYQVFKRETGMTPKEYKLRGGGELN